MSSFGAAIWPRKRGASRGRDRQLLAVKDQSALRWAAGVGISMKSVKNDRRHASSRSIYWNNTGSKSPKFFHASIHSLNSCLPNFAGNKLSTNTFLPHSAMTPFRFRPENPYASPSSAYGNGAYAVRSSKKHPCQIQGINNTV